MSKSGRRWIGFCFGLWVMAGCGPNASPSPNTPTVVVSGLNGLTPYTATQASELYPPYLNSPIQTFPSHASHLQFAPPTCQETLSNALVCWGWIQNTSQEPSPPLSVTIQLVDGAGQVQASHTALTLRDWLPPQGGSPYRLIFEEVPLAALSTPLTPLVSFEEISTSPLARYILLPLEEIQQNRRSNGVQVGGMLHNPTESTLYEVRVIITAQDELGRVLNARVLEFAQIEAGARLPFEGFLAPNGGHIQISADALRP